MTNQLKRRFEIIESALRQGHGDAARRDLILSTRGRLSRESRKRAARLARFAGVPLLGLQLLHPRVRSKKATSDADPERLEYAASLMALGVQCEALNLLQSITSEDLIEKELLQALIYIARKDPASSHPFLERYLASKSLTPDQRIIARLNVVAGLIQRNQPVQREIKELRASLSADSPSLLRGTLLELAAQHAIFREQWDQADSYLDEATRTLGHSGFQFFVRKWRAILSLRRTGGSPESREAIESLKEEASRSRQWEALRDLDKHAVFVTRDFGRFLHLYCGTPYEVYRRELLQSYGTQRELPAYYDWRMGPTQIEPHLIDLTDPTQNRLLTLTSDFYRPLRPAEIFEHWHPRELFDPFGTLDRMRDEMAELRHALKESDVPLTIDEVSGGYQLSPTASCAVRISIESASPSRKTA
jgi:hypothetical protein